MAEIIVRSLDHLRHQVDAGPHTLYADEPADVGGDDSGPDPYELLLSALGTCTSMTLLMYARRKKWPLEGVEVRLTHDHDYAQDAADCEDKESRVELITREISVRGPLDEQQRARLLEIAQKCPVHQTLLGTLEVRDTLTGPEAGG